MQRLTFQFWLDIPFVFQVARIVDRGVIDEAEVARQLKVGVDKARPFLRWAQLLGLLEEEQSKEANLRTTDLYKILLQLGKKEQDTLELIYFITCKRHLITAFLVNDVAYPRRFSGFTREEARYLIEERSQEFKAKLSTLKSQASRHLRGLIHRKGFGNLGLIQKRGTRYSIASFEPNPLIAAYIIYTNWPPNTAKVAISQIVSGSNSVGRIFFLTKFQVISILRELEDRGLVKIETAAGLDQIGRDPHITPEDILEMILAEV